MFLISLFNFIALKVLFVPSARDSVIVTTYKEDKFVDTIQNLPRQTENSNSSSSNSSSNSHFLSTSQQQTQTLQQQTQALQQQLQALQAQNQKMQTENSASSSNVSSQQQTQDSGPTAEKRRSSLCYTRPSFKKTKF